ncbi:ABC transporter permease [Luteimonas fraxinea]|uniref:ABC transporter permease n=1 Tax=Luteimonas fraxinea TaxID=2901869 RepID=A0ABS8U8P6_9GAMM|nr:ABC transporter permease [Luteimonas fraxinea]MCD9095377.1 ABC transporter permease [Luteimonas fraxinea]MCD9126383.1 ABC transporter permease [Luteimonas fraxinea]UHH11409.1 ABC transporter permease [Luteimonas fraxinea]
MRRTLANIYRLGVKELWSLWRDPIMLALIVFTFTFAVYSSASSMPETLNNAPLAVVDEDNSQLSQRIVSAFYPPQFAPPAMIGHAEVDPGLDAGTYTFVMNIPVNFQRDVLAGRAAQIQLNTDATRMTQAFTGSGYIQQVTMAEINEFVSRYRGRAAPPVDLALRARFNPALDKSWFGGLSQIINQITMLSIILTGAALIREREHGTIEHLLVMPVTPAEIMLAKIWSMGLVVLVAAALSLNVVVRGLLDVPVAGSATLFFAGAALLLFATTSLGIFMATVARNMPQFGMLVVLVLLPLQMLSGGSTPFESMPAAVQRVMQLAPTTHFVELGQAILFRGAGLDVVWPRFLALLGIGGALFFLSLQRFRNTIAQMA